MSIPIISFYSYKGGSGRTTTTVNTISHLAKQLGASKESPLLVADLDLESAGLTYFYNLQNKFYTGSKNCKLSSIDASKLLNVRSLMNDMALVDTIFHPDEDELEIIDQKYFDDLSKIAEVFRFNIDVLTKVKISVSQARLIRDLVHVYNTEKDEFSKHSKFRMEEFLGDLHAIKDKPECINETLNRYLPYTTFADISSHYQLEEGSIKFLGIDDNVSISLNHTEAPAILLQLKDLCEENNYCGIICDSSSGRQSTAHILHAVSDIIVYCMRPTKQFRIGTSNNLSYYKDSLVRRSNGPHLSNTKIIVLPTAVPQKANEKSVEIFKEIQDIIVKGYSDCVDGYFCEHDHALCEVESFKWSESILNMKPNKTEDELRAVQTYMSLSSRIVDNLNR